MHIEEVEEEEEEEEEYDFENNLPHGLLRDYEEKEVVSEHTQAIQDILTRAKVKRTVNAPQVIFKPKTTSPKEEPAQEGDGQETGMIPEETEQETIQAVYSLMGNLNVTCEITYKKCYEKLRVLLARLRLDQNVRSRLKSMFLSHAEDPSLLWRQQEGLRNLQRLKLLNAGDICQIGAYLVNLNPALRALALNILKEVYQISDKQALGEELQKTMR